MRVTPPPMPPAPMASSYPTTLEEGMRYRTPVFAGVALLMSAAMAVAAFFAVETPRGRESSNPMGSLLYLWLGLAGAGLVIQAVLLYRARTGSLRNRWFRARRASQHPGRDSVINVGTQPLLPILFGTMASWDKAWPLAIFGSIGLSHLVLAWLYIPAALQRMSASAAA